MVLVPPGCFGMGSDQHFYDENPIHDVCFETAFWLDRYEVTNGQFAAWGGQSAQPSRWTGADRPVDRLTWAEAEAYCQGRGARLPTEAEWEYAARGPQGWKFPWGNWLETENVVYAGNSDLHTADIGSRPAGVSWVGALDMSGNVSEWVADWYGASYYPTLADGVIDPQGPQTGKQRLSKGGGFNSDGDLLRAAYRFEMSPGGLFGVRCARSD